jgi:hypothetical protein
MNDIEQRQIKMFCLVFLLLFIVVVVLAAIGSLGLALQV